MKDILKTTKSLVIAIILVGGISTIYAWTGPSQAAPGGNVPAPVNVGTVGQIKQGFFAATNLLANNIFTTGKVGIGTNSPANNEVMRAEASQGNWSFMASRNGAPIGGIHTNDGLLTIQAVNGGSIYLREGKVGINTNSLPSNLTLTVNNSIGSDWYCAKDGSNCFQPSSTLGSAGDLSAYAKKPTVYDYGKSEKSDGHVTTDIDMSNGNPNICFLTRVALTKNGGECFVRNDGGWKLYFNKPSTDGEETQLCEAKCLTF